MIISFHRDKFLFTDSYLDDYVRRLIAGYILIFLGNLYWWVTGGRLRFRQICVHSFCWVWESVESNVQRYFFSAVFVEIFLLEILAEAAWQSEFCKELSQGGISHRWIWKSVPDLNPDR